MDLKTFCLAMFIAAAFDSWPNLAKPLGIKPGVVAFVVIVFALVVLAIMAFKDITEIRTISAKAFAVLIVFSIANGLAIYLFTEKVADKNVQTGTFLVTVFVLQVVFAPVIDWLITGVRLNSYQFIGLGLAMSTIWFLSQRQQ